MPQDLEKIVLGVAVDRAYSDEPKLLWTIGVRNEDDRCYREIYKRGRYKVGEDIRACEAFCIC